MEELDEDEDELMMLNDLDEEGGRDNRGERNDPGATQQSGYLPTITDKQFYKEMQRLKERGNNAVPPKKSASAYILFGKEVGKYLKIPSYWSSEKGKNTRKGSDGEGHSGRKGDSTVLETFDEGRATKV